MSKFWIVLLALLVVAVLAGAGVGGHQASKSNTFCIGCHAYEKVAWDHGDHFNTDCIDCHTKGLVDDKVQGMRKVYLMATGQNNPHNDPSGRSYPRITSDNCQGCHMGPEVEESDPAFFEEHTAFMADGGLCLDCHADTGHDPELQALKTEAPRYESGR
ncbi:MAG: NapC/NirT family cytochrome c [Ectothiorhodospira sp.]